MIWNFRPLALRLVTAVTAACATTPKVATPLKCHKYVIAPPAHADARASRFVAERWLAAVRSKMRECDRVVPFDLAEREFGLLNIANDNPWYFFPNVRSFLRRQL